MKRKNFYTAILMVCISLLFVSCAPDKQPLPVLTASNTATFTPPVSLTSTPTFNPQPVPQTAMFRAGLEHVGVYLATSETVEWTFAVKGEILSSPVIDRDVLYFGSMGGSLYAVDLGTGQEKWSFEAPAVGSSPTKFNNTLYFGDGAGAVYAVDAATGKQQWVYKAGAEIISSPAVSNEAVYIGSGDGNVYALARQTGALIWQFKTQGRIISSPALTEDLVIIGSTDTFLYALERNTGKVRWLFEASGEVQSSPAVYFQTVYFGSLGGFFYALDLNTGKEKWKFQTQGPVVSSPAVSEGQVYFGSMDKNLYSLNAETGDVQWQFPARAEIISSPAVTGEGIYFGNIDGRFFALDPRSGDELWRFQTQGEIWSSPAVAGEGVYFGSYDSNLYALRRQGPQLALAPTATSRPLLPTPTMLPKSDQPIPVGTAGQPWWNDRIFYEVFVRSFKDSNGDGNGDLKGLISQLDYLNDGDPATTQDLGVTGLWLMPVTESPSYHGYDVMDYKTVEQDYGTNEDVKQLIAEAHKRGMVVIVDLVMNHTSSQHPWFVEAQQPGSEHENWYIWQNENPAYLSPWGTPVWHKLGTRYFYGLFWEGMPDLNYNNGAVTAAMFDVIRFWLKDMEVDGFRLDAVRHIIEEGQVQENTVSTHNWLKNFYRWVRSLSPQAVTVGEAWTSTEEVVKFVGDEVDLAFEFDLAKSMLESTQRGDNYILVNTEQQVLSTFPKGQYATFLSNHDQNRAFTQLMNDPQSAKVAATLLLTHPGVPFIYYGEEVGMRGAKPDERLRTPMQWDASPTAGFTTGTPWEVLAPDSATLNVAMESNDPNSLLSHYRNLIQLRQAYPALRVGDMQLVNSDNRKVFSFLRHVDGETVMVLVNLSPEEVSDYQLSLDHGPLTKVSRVQRVLGEGQPVKPILNSRGGFETYKPLPVLPSRSSTILLLKP